jgi:hypothetical protein
MIADGNPKQGSMPPYPKDRAAVLDIVKGSLRRIRALDNISALRRSKSMGKAAGEECEQALGA